MFTLVGSAHITAHCGLHLACTSLFQCNAVLSPWHFILCDLTFIFWLLWYACDVSSIWFILNWLLLAVCPLRCVCACVFVNVCIYVPCLALQCGEGPMQGYSPRVLSWEGEAGGCSGSLWLWSWGVCVCPGRHTHPPLPPPPHTHRWWTTQRKKWTSHASTHAHVKSKKACCMCTVMGGASLMSARYQRCSFIFQRTWSCTTLYCHLAHYHALSPSIISCL